MKTHLIKDLENLKSFSKDLMQSFSTKQIIFLSGDLGSGKTTFVKSVLEDLNYFDVFSPTFGIHQVYQTKKIEVDHFDLYRIKDLKELNESGFFEVFSKDQSWIFIEWPEILKSTEFPLWNKMSLHFEIKDLEVRKISIQK